MPGISQEAPSYPDDVQVRCADGSPAQFLWRHRVYVVRGVLAHWAEAGAWWQLDPGPGPDPDLSMGAQREVWRVEARAGMQGGSGVFVLSRDPAVGRWSLARGSG
ncbi:MAG: DUF6504 family protein [Actinomycetes bacterium]